MSVHFGVFLLSISTLAALPVPVLSFLWNAAGSENFADFTSEQFHRRSLRQTSTAVCQWDESIGRCAISDVAQAALFEQSESPYAKLLLRYAECRIQGPNAASCNSLEDCVWDLHLGACHFVGFHENYSESPCFSPVVKTLEHNAMALKCPSFDSTECLATKECIWDASIEFCYVDSFMVYLGIESSAFYAGMQEVDVAKSRAAFDLFRSEFDFDLLDPEWSEALDWEVPESDCPEGNDPLVCEYVDAYLPLVLPTRFYCESKYDGSLYGSRCDDDDLCSYDASRGQCLHDYSVTRQALDRADEVLLRLVPKTADRKSFKARLRCHRIRQEEECTDDCEWRGQGNGSCGMGEAFFMNLLVSQSERDPHDPLCLFFNLPLVHDCSDRMNIASCYENENCQWNLIAQACMVGRNANLNLLKDEDEDLAEAAAQQDLICAAHQNPHHCGRA